MENPFKFHPQHHRVVTNFENKQGKVLVGTGFIYAFSLYWYSRRFFRIDQNTINAAAFAAFSLPVAYAYSKFFLSDANTEAAMMNNSKEGVF
mmetsp:Transcript_9016/g.13786  ORF Transcript_9016/g.13786 Transcript_9016/m.13786 type:complete len:92 (+) Transcript_9016:12-287(+)